MSAITLLGPQLRQLTLEWPAQLTVSGWAGALRALRVASFNSDHVVVREGLHRWDGAVNNLKVARGQRQLQWCASSLMPVMPQALCKGHIRVLSSPGHLALLHAAGCRLTALTELRLKSSRVALTLQPTTARSILPLSLLRLRMEVGGGHCGVRGEGCLAMHGACGCCCAWLLHASSPALPSPTPAAGMQECNLGFLPPAVLALPTAPRVGMRARCGGFDSQQGHCNWADALSVSCSSGNA